MDIHGGNLFVLSGSHINYRIFGLSRQGGLGVDGYSFEVLLRSRPVAGGASVPYVWENGQPGNVNVFYSYRYCLDGMPEAALRQSANSVPNALPVPDSPGQVLICITPGSFEVAQPITTLDDGWLVNDQGILQVNTG